MELSRTLLVLALTAIWLLAGCTGSSQTAPTNGATGFLISPKAIGQDQAITITLPAIHPSKLAIRDNMGTWHYIHDVDEKILLMSTGDFDQAREIRILPSQVTGVSWNDGRRVEDVVFSGPGEYLIYLADDLETEPDNTFSLMGKVILKE